MVSHDEMAVIALLVAPYTAAAAWRSHLRPRSAVARHALAAAFSVATWSAAFGPLGIVMLATSALILFIWMRCAGAARPLGPALLCLVAFAHLSFNRLAKQLTKFGDMSFDATAPQMVLVVKVTWLAWSIHDGATLSPHDVPSSTEIASQIAFLEESAVKRPPSLIEFFGYIFFFCGFIVGPAFSFAEYRRFIHGEPPFNKIPNSTIPAARPAAIGIVSLIGFSVLGSRFPYAWAASPSFSKLTIYSRIGYLLLAAFAARLKFYGVWKLSEGACVACGFGYNPVRRPSSGHYRWDRLSNVDILGLETAQNIKTVLDCWNINTARWLRHSVYIRLHAYCGHHSFVPTLATFIVSAIWHGWYLGYYLTFITGALMLHASRQARRSFRPIVMRHAHQAGYTKSIYDVVSWLTTQIAIAYACAPFIVLSARDGLRIWKSTWFIGHIGIVLIWLAAWLLQPTPIKIYAPFDPLATIGAPTTRSYAKKE